MLDPPTARTPRSQRPRSSGTLARRLVDDIDSGVRRAAASNPNLADAAQLALNRGDLAVLTAVIERDDVPVGLAQELCLAVLGHPERNVFEAASAVRRHPGLDAADLASLLADPALDATVAAAALGKAAAPVDVVLQHVIDPDPHVRCAVLEAVLDRALPITEEALQAAETAPTVPGRSEQAWSGWRRR